MASTTFISRVTRIAREWLQDVNDCVYGPTAPITTLRGQLTSTASTADGDARIGVLSTRTGAVATTQHEVNERQFSFFDNMTDVQRSDAMGTTSTGSDHTVELQASLVALALAGGTLTSPQGATYKTTAQLILPFGSNTEAKQFLIDFNDSVIDSEIASPTGATFTGLISGYLSGSTPVANTSGSETHVAYNTVVKNLLLRGFGTAVRLHNFNYGCALENIQADNCFNGVELSRCFCLKQDGLYLLGTGAGDGGVGYKTSAFSNIMPADSIKVKSFTTGHMLSGFDGGKMTNCAAESCEVGVEFFGESTVMHLDVIYLEGNTTCNMLFSSVVRQLTLSNSWLRGDADKHITSTMAAGEYSTITSIGVKYDGGITTSPAIENMFGDIITPVSDPTNAPVFTGIPNVRVLSPKYEIDTSALGYNGPVRSLDTRNFNGLIPTAYGGRFRNGISAANTTPFQTVADNAGSLEFTTEFVSDGFTSLLWRVEIAHSIGTWSRTYLVFFDNDASDFRLYKPDAAGLTVDTTANCVSVGGFLVLRAPVFTTPSANYSVVRAI